MSGLVTIQELFPQQREGVPEDRLPPQDLHAEQSVLGGMLLSKDAIADCVEALRSADFYRPQHEAIFDAILGLYGRGEPADAITVSDELGKRGDLGRVGGQAYLHQLISSVPTAANAGYYAQIVAERAVLRRLVDAGTRIVQMGFGQGGGDVEDIVNAAQAEVYAVVDKRGAEDYHRLGDILEMTVDEIEVASGKSGEMTGVPTGFTDLDSLTNGLHPGQMIDVAARPAIGKALALDTPLPTPDGWTTMADVAVGDRVLGSDGRPVRVVASTEVMQGRPCYEVEFSDGSVIVADAQHQWLTETRASRRSFQSARDGRNRQRHQRTFAAVRTTEEIAATLRTPTTDVRLNHSVGLTSPLQLPEADLPLSPYVLGAWLGDGTSDAATITTADEEMVMYLEAEGLVVTPTSALMRYSLRLPPRRLDERTCLVCGSTFQPATSQVRTCGRSCGGRSRGLAARRTAPTCRDCGGPASGLDRCQQCRHHHGTVQGILRSMGVLGSKRIPSEYLRASEQQRRALLAGLLDTDGTVSRTGSIQLTTTSAELVSGYRELIVSLGYRANVMPKRVKGRTEASSTAYTVNFTSNDDVFRLSRKSLRHKEVRTRTFERRHSRFIVDVRPVTSVPVRCIEVDSDDHLPGRPVDDPHAQLHAGSRHRPQRVDQAQPRVGDLLVGDEQDRDHHAAAVRRGRDPAAAHAQGHDARGGLDPLGVHDGPRLGCAVVRRRLAQHVVDGDPGQVPATQAAQQPQARGHRLPPADVLGQEGRVAAAGGLRVLPGTEAAGQGARGPGRRDLPAQPRSRAAHRQEAADVRSS